MDEKDNKIKELEGKLVRLNKQHAKTAFRLRESRQKIRIIKKILGDERNG